MKIIIHFFEKSFDKKIYFFQNLNFWHRLLFFLFKFCLFQKYKSKDGIMALIILIQNENKNSFFRKNFWPKNIEKVITFSPTRIDICDIVFGTYDGFRRTRINFFFLLEHYFCQPHKGQEEIIGFKIRKIKANFHHLSIVHHFWSFKITVWIQITRVITKIWQILILTKKLEKYQFFSKPPHNWWFSEKPQFWTKTPEQIRKKVVQN